MPNFTEAQYEDIRDTLELSTDVMTIGDLMSRGESLNPSQAAKVLTYIAAYKKSGTSTVRVYGGGKGTDFSGTRDRLLLANKIRTLLRYSITTPSGLDDPTAFASFRLALPSDSGVSDENCAW